MKKFIIALSVLVLLFMALDAAHYRLGWYIDLMPEEPVTTFVKTDGKEIYLDCGEGWQPFEIRGVNMGSGIPGKWATEFAIDEETYRRWFGYIQAMGANTVRVYTIQGEAFYNAFYEYNKDNPEPLYLIHGVWVNDYVQNSHRDAYDKDFYETFLQDCRTMLDVVHGQRRLAAQQVQSAGYGSYKKDISPWVIGYILGVEWDDMTVAYTDDTYAGREGYTSYEGKYLTTTDKATPFEVLLARVGDKVLEYESSRYKTQKLIAFSNWPTTDTFQYPDEIKRLYMKCATVDVEHICTTERVISGQFASYHVYPYYPDYLNWTEDWSGLGLEDHEIFRDEDSRMNTYRAYLTGLVAHHTMPVVISEFGVSTGRGMAHRDLNTGRNQGNMTEQEQGMALATCYEDIKAAGCAGSVVFAWQDEWFKRTWNTMHAVNLTRTPYWSDIQTNEQYFGLLAFDPGQEQTVCTLDGDPTEWTEMDVIGQNEGMTLSAKYDERYLYLMVRKEGWTPEGETLYLPIDTTPKTGTSYCQNFGLKFDRGVDFLVVLDGRENSRVMVQEPYEVLRSTYSQNVWGYDTYLRDNLPDPHAPGFTNIDMILEIFNEGEVMTEAIIAKYGGATFETGRLRYGCGDPASAAYDSLADFMTREGCIELRLPWQLLNFADPSKMQILDDYYNGNYGIEHINIDEMYLGVMTAEQESRCELSPLTLTGWGNRVTYHERLKASYYMMQELWNG